MKRFLVYAITGLFLVIYSCKSLPSEGGNSIDYDFKFDLYSHVKWYYRANLKYPSVGELKNFCWKIIDDANDNTFSSFSDFEKSINKKRTGREDLLQYLSMHKDDLSFEIKNKSMDVFWKGKKWMKFKFDLGEMIKKKSSLFTYFYNSSGYCSKDFDYEEEFYIIRKEIRDKYVTDTMQRSKFQPCLLRYDRDRGYQLYSPSKSRIKQSIYLNKLGCALDTFLLNRDIQMIQFVTNLPEDYFSKE